LGRVAAAQGQFAVPVDLSIMGLPPGSRVEGFGCAIRFPTPHLTLLGTLPRLPGDARVFLIDQMQDGANTVVYLQVLPESPVLFEGGRALTLLFDVHWVESDEDPPQGNDPEEEIDPSKGVILPIGLAGGGDCWISVEGYKPLYPIPTLIGGSIIVDLKTGVRLGSVHAFQGGVAEVPLQISAVGPVSYLTVGIDYDEDMLEVFAVTVSPEAAPFVRSATLTPRKGGVLLTVEAEAGGLPYPVARMPLVTLQVWVNPSAPAGAELPIGSQNENEVWVRPVSVTRPVIYSVGRITVRENLRERFLRGDANRDGKINTSDPIAVLEYLFGGQDIPCPDSSDVDDSGTINLADVTALLGYLFGRDPIPPAPFPEPGLDPTYDELPACK